MVGQGRNQEEFSRAGVECRRAGWPVAVSGRGVRGRGPGGRARGEQRRYDAGGWRSTEARWAGPAARRPLRGLMGRGLPGVVAERRDGQRGAPDAGGCSTAGTGRGRGGGLIGTRNLLRPAPAGPLRAALIPKLREQGAPGDVDPDAVEPPTSPKHEPPDPRNGLPALRSTLRRTAVPPAGRGRKSGRAQGAGTGGKGGSGDDAVTAAHAARPGKGSAGPPRSRLRRRSGTALA